MKHLKKFENHPGLTDYAYNMRMGEVDEKNYEATDDNPVVQEFLKDLKNYYDQHHDDLYDMKNFIHALGLLKEVVEKDIMQQLTKRYK